VVGSINPEYATYDCQGNPVNDPWPTAFASGGMDLDAVGVIHDLEHFPALPNEPPYIANPVDDVVFNEFPEAIVIDLEGVVNDPDDPEENITYMLVSNSNESELSASLRGRILRLTRLSSEEGEAVLALQATSHGHTVDFEINVVMHYVYDDVDDDEAVMISIYPNPTHDVIFVEAKAVQRVEVFNVAGQTLKMHVPSLGVNEWLKKYAANKINSREGYDEDFLTFAPMLIRDYRDLSQRAYEEMVGAARLWNVKEWSVVSYVTEKLGAATEPKIKYINEDGAEVEIPLTFRGGLRSIFMLSNPLQSVC
jgi:hypothetical protein